MSTNPNPLDSELSFELPCIELIMAMLANAIEEIEQLNHPIPRLRQRTVYFGKRKNNFSDLHWFLTSPDGAELLTTAAGIDGILERYRRLAMPMLRKAEELAKATPDESSEDRGGNPTVALISAPETTVRNTPNGKEIQIAKSGGGNPYSSVDIFPISPSSPVAVNLPVRAGKTSQVNLGRESYSSVDIIAPEQAELFPDFFNTGRVAI